MEMGARTHNRAILGGAASIKARKRDFRERQPWNPADDDLFT
jgi:hypothetical protein